VQNFTAIDLQLYKIFEIMPVSFFGTQCIVVWKLSSHMHQKKADNKAAALAVTDVLVTQRVRLHTLHYNFH